MKKDLTPSQRENRQKWIQALRSGTYQQDKKVLRTAAGKYCCLGVCADVLSPENWAKSQLRGGSGPEIACYNLNPVKDFLRQFPEHEGWDNYPYTGVLYSYILNFVGLSKDEQNNLISLNDLCDWTFLQIADLLESEEEIDSSFVQKASASLTITE